MKRKPFYFIPLIVAVSYTAILLAAGALAVNPLIAGLHPESMRYQLGARVDHMYPILAVPIMPLAWFLKGLDGWGRHVSYFIIFIYIFALCCVPAAILRRPR